MNLTFVTAYASLTLLALTQKDEIRNYPGVVVQTTIAASPGEAFNYIVPVKLEHIFKRYKNIPAVVRTDEGQLWFTPGLSRRVYFEDGTTAQETLVSVISPSYFSYKIEKFTSQLRFLAKSIEGSWRFTPLPNGTVHIEWTYKIIPKNFMSRLVIHLFLLADVRGLLTNALAILKADLEAAVQRVNE